MSGVPDRGQFVGEVLDEAESEQNEMIKKIVLFLGDSAISDHAFDCV